MLHNATAGTLWTQIVRTESHTANRRCSSPSLSCANQSLSHPSLPLLSLALLNTDWVPTCTVLMRSCSISLRIHLTSSTRSPAHTSTRMTTVNMKLRPWGVCGAAVISANRLAPEFRLWRVGMLHYLFLTPAWPSPRVRDSRQTDIGVSSSTIVKVMPYICAIRPIRARMQVARHI